MQDRRYNTLREAHAIRRWSARSWYTQADVQSVRQIRAKG